MRQSKLRHLALGCLLLLGCIPWQQGLFAQAKITLQKGQLVLSGKNVKTQSVPLKNTVSALVFGKNGWELHAVKTKLKPDYKSLGNVKGIKLVSGDKLVVDLGSKGQAKWSAASPNGNLLIQGLHDLHQDGEMIMHGDDAGNVFIFPECIPFPLHIVDGEFHLMGKKLGKVIALGLSPEYETGRTVLACGDVGVAIDVLDNIDDPSRRYAEMMDEFFDRMPHGTSDYRDADNLEDWTRGFCSEFEYDSNAWIAPSNEYHTCRLDFQATNLYLDCEGMLLVARNGDTEMVDLSTCPLLLAVQSPDEIIVASKESDCLSAFHCE